MPWPPALLHWICVVSGPYSVAAGVPVELAGRRRAQACGCLYLCRHLAMILCGAKFSGFI